MCYRGWKSFLRIFRGEHDFGALFAFVSLVYWVFAPATKGGRQLHVKRGPNCAFMTEIAYIKERAFGSEPHGGDVEAAATRKRPGLRPSHQSHHGRAGWPPFWL